MTPYFIEGGVVVFDITHAPAVGVVCDDIRAYGKIYVFDLETLGKMPFVGRMCATLNDNFSQTA